MKRKQLHILALMAAMLLAACSEEAAVTGQSGDDAMQQLTFDITETSWDGENINVTTRSGETLEGLRITTKDLSWNDFENMCHFVDQHLCMIASKLRQKQILNETEVRLCILVLLNLNRKQISETLPYSLNSVGKLKDHTAKLLGTTGKNLHDFLLNMAIEG